MKIVNKSGIPDSIFRYLKTDLYDHEAKGDSISVTELLKPVQAMILRRRYDSQLEGDAIDQLWKLLGTGVHSILEKEKGIEKIERLKTVVLGREISGKFDRIFQNKITDYKVTSSWSVAYGSREDEWVWQLSIYRWLYWKVKGVVLADTGAIVAILRDWSEKNLKPNKYGKVNEKYPKAPALELNYELKHLDETEKFVEQQVKKILKEEKAEDMRLEECTDEERWFNNEKKVYMRCEKYCEVKGFCQQFKRQNMFENIETAEVVE